MKHVFRITTELEPHPLWFHMRFRNGWGGYIIWGPLPVEGSGQKVAEVDVTYNDVPTGERHGWLPPEKILSLLAALSKRPQR
jgi:hypothetical protein